jgi:RecJ-like exonuclease
MGDFHRRFEPREPITLDIVDKPFIAQTEVLAKLRPKMIEAIKMIHTAISQQRRIILKHHADCDGFCAGIALERAILPLIDMANEKKQAVWEKYKRLPSVSPYYNLEDATKDIAQFLTVNQRFNEKTPLVILTDLGSGPENVLPLKQLKMFGCDIIVIDHHPIEPEVVKLVTHHINPTEFGEDHQLCAGILCAEMSRMMYKDTFGEDLLAAIACVGDRVVEEDAKPYFDLVAPHGYDQAMLLKIAKALDFTVYNMRNIEGRELLGIILGDDVEKQKQWVGYVNEELAKREEKIHTQADAMMKITNLDNISYITLPIDQLTIRDGYPRLGNIVGMLNDKMKPKTEKPLIMIGTLPNQLTFRASELTKFNYPELQKFVAQKVPLSFVEGGGHPHAGTFRFAESQYDAVWNATLEYLKTV